MASAHSTFQAFQPSSEKFSAWLCRLENYLRYEQKTKPEEKQCAILAFMGPEAFKRFFDKVPSDKGPENLTFDEIKTVLEKIYEPVENLWSSRLSFRGIRQNSGEALIDFEARVRTAGRRCKWTGEELQMNLIEQFIGGLTDQTIQQAILVKCATSKDLSDVFATTEELINARKSTAAFRNGQSHVQPTSDVNKIHGAGRSSSGKGSKMKKKNSSESRNPERRCYRCGRTNHLAPDCRYKDAVCDSCKTKGHLASVCRKTQSQHLLEEVPFHCIDEHGKEPIQLKVRIHGREIEMELDTGSGVSTIEYRKFLRMFPNETLHQNDVRLRSATREFFEPRGYAEIPVSYNDLQRNLKLYLVDIPNFPTLFGRQWLRSFNKSVLDVNICENNFQDYEEKALQLLAKYPNLSKDGIGKIPNVEASIHLRCDPKPSYSRPRPVPHALLPLVDAELDHLEKFDVVERVDSSEWAHPAVIALRGKGELSKRKARICGDFKVGLNQFLVVDDHPLKNIRHALDNIGVGKKFSKLDVSNAFLHMPIRAEDRKYLTVNTHRGLYRFKRMCNGLASAPAIWQRFMEGILAGIDGVEVVMDDIVVSAVTDDEHLKRLEAVLQRLEENDLRLNRSKCNFFAEEIKFCGFKLKHQQIHKCDDKISSFKNAPKPKSVSELKSFIGMIQFYSSFAPQLADIAHPLYKAFKGSSQKFEWTSEMDKAFEMVKAEMCSPRILVPFDPTRILLLATDASSHGISAVLSHRYDDNTERPIAYYSRTLTDTEKRYTQLEKEALGIKEGVSRFFYYLFGRRFELITDSKPLVSILSPSKALPPLAAMRMTHYSMFLQSFNYDIKYRNTNEHGNADMLSRLPTKSEDFVAPQETHDILLIEIRDSVPLDVTKIAEMTRNCEVLRPILEWLQGMTTIPRIRWRMDLSELTVVKNVIFRGHRVVIPVACRTQVLDMLHEEHFGSDKMKELARRYVWWDTVNADIEQVARSCTICAQNAKQPNRTFHPWEPAENPFDRVHLDYAGPIDGQYLFLLVDAHTKWLEVSAAPTKTTETTLKHLREIVARFGLPKVIVTDNDPTFKSEDFKKFCRSNGIKAKNSPPFHPASNGQVERYVCTTKQALKKIKDEGEKDLHTALQRFLFRHRMVPSSSTRKTPAELMLGRQLRSRLDLLAEQPPSPFEPTESTKYKAGDNVMSRSYNDKRKWIPGIVIKPQGRKVVLVESEGRTSLRHHNQLQSRRSSKFREIPNISNRIIYEPLHPALLVADDPVTTEASEYEDRSNESSFQDAEDVFEESEEEAQPEEIAEAQDASEEVRIDTPPAEPNVTLRRSARRTAGVPPVRFQNTL